jgi:hypothetical protein
MSYPNEEINCTESFPSVSVPCWKDQEMIFVSQKPLDHDKKLKQYYQKRVIVQNKSNLSLKTSLQNT